MLTSGRPYEKCFQELLLLGVDSETALSTSNKGFDAVDDAVNHLKLENKLSFITSSSCSSQSTYTSSNPHNNTVSKSYKHKQQDLEEYRRIVSDHRLIEYNDCHKQIQKPIQKHFEVCPIESCKSIRSLIEVMLWYEELKNTQRNSNKLLQYGYKLLLNDFHHILNVHLSIGTKTMYETQKQYELIYAAVSKYIPNCDINTCSSYHRNSRDKALDDQKGDSVSVSQTNVFCDAQITFFVETIDMIHCYFLHSFDTGMRIKVKYLRNKNKSQQTIYTTHDSCVKRIKSRIYKLIAAQKQNESIVNWRNNIQSKFFTKLPSKIKTKTTFRSQSTISKPNLSNYFGYGYYYHRYYRDKRKEWYVCQKYDNLKDEIINNRIYSLTLNVLNAVMTKAAKNCQSRYAKRLYAKDTQMSEYLKIRLNSRIKPHHLMSLILFCDYFDLSHVFKSTFRKLNNSETNQQMMNRHGEFWWFGKTLTETVQLFGTTISSNKAQIFYYGVSKCKIPILELNNMSPISMTPCIEVAIKSFIQHNNSGMLLEMRGLDEYSNIKSFDCSWISSYGNENEHIFFNGTQQSKIKINNIRILHTNENYYVFIKALDLLNQMIKATELTEANKSKITDSDFYIVHSLMKHLDSYQKYSNNKIPKYVHKLFKTFCVSQTKIQISLDMIKNVYNGFDSYLIHPNCSNLIDIFRLLRIFVNVKKIIIYGIQNMSDLYLNILLQMLENMEGIENKLVSLTLVNVQYDYQCLDSLFLQTYSMQFHIRSRCKLHIQIKDRLIYNASHKSYKKSIERTDLLIIRKTNNRKRNICDTSEESDVCGIGCETV